VSRPSNGQRPTRLAMMYGYPSTHHDGVSLFANRLLKALKDNANIQAHVVAPRRLGAAPRQPFIQLLVALELLWGLVVTPVSANTAHQLQYIATPTPRNIMVIHGASDIIQRDIDDSEVVGFRSAIALTSGPVLCQIGLNFPRKVEGALRLIEAGRAVREEFPGVHLILVGDGPLRQSVEEKCRELGMSNSTTITGFLNDVSLPLALADVYCHITLQDACPLSVLEAMRCARPIIAARVGGIPELIEDGVDGLLVEPDPIDIASAIKGLLRDPLRASALGSRAKATAMRQFSWDRAAAEFAVAYAVSADKKWSDGSCADRRTPHRAGVAL
jgi:glycosyltransferase involved in cell wall biosynthesis